MPVAIYQAFLKSPQPTFWYDILPFHKNPEYTWLLYDGEISAILIGQEMGNKMRYLLLCPWKQNVILTGSDVTQYSVCRGMCWAHTHITTPLRIVTHIHIQSIEVCWTKNAGPTNRILWADNNCTQISFYTLDILTLVFWFLLIIQFRNYYIEITFTKDSYLACRSFLSCRKKIILLNLM